MCGDNRYVHLIILTAIELYINSEFYSKHPSFILSSIDSILDISVSTMLLIVIKLRENWFKMKP